MGQETNLLINITIQSFKSENELELSLVKWDAVKEKFMPRLDRNGLARFPRKICRAARK